MAVRYEFECADHHEFALWSDSPRCCPECGSEFLKRIFTTPPAVNTPRTKALDNLIRNQLEAQGITNIQGGGHEGDRERVTWKTQPEELKAEKIYRDFPQARPQNNANSIADLDKAVKMKWGGLGVKGVVAANIPGNDTLKSMIPVGATYRDGKLRATAPAGPNAFKTNDRHMVKRIVTKDPENLQVKR